MTEKTFSTREEFCAYFFPRAHAARECGCYPKERGVLVILPRPGVNPQRRGR